MKLVELCQQGQNLQAIQTLYSPDIVSLEPISIPSMPAEVRGLQAVLGKNKWWNDNHVLHSSSCDGPYPHGHRFIVRFSFDVTNTNTQKRIQMNEMALYTVENGKITHEEFFYITG